MSLVREQAVFLLHVSELIRKASELGFLTSGGELYRTPEQQALHVQHGRSKTMKSLHLKRLAVDLNFFREAPDGTLKLTYDRDELQVLGAFWESLDPANRWGGNWTSFKDAPHFERQDRTSTPTSSPVPSAGVNAQRAAPASTSRGGAGIILAAVGPQCLNQRDDVETVQRLLNLCAADGRVQIDDDALKADGAFGQKTLKAIMAFQRGVLGEQAPNGRVDAGGPVVTSLCASLPSDLDAALLGLIYLRAADRDVADLSKGMASVMANRQIDTPLRQAHFLAQIGHESGELRFRAEIASGEAYEGRDDLGNTQPGDGRRFKGRGLIQLTGRANYREYGRAIGREAELLADPELLATDSDLCVDVAGWFWVKRNLNTLADADDLTGITKRINGGLNGLEDRRRLLKRAKALLSL
jgi:predicted chitinase/peptidoglycan hydrolase-like protein with peptidoglycan-binding domain